MLEVGLLAEVRPVVYGLELVALGSCWNDAARKRRGVTLG